MKLFFDENKSSKKKYGQLKTERLTLWSIITLINSNSMVSGSKGNFTETISHPQSERVVMDFGSAPVRGIHAGVVEKLREYHGLESGSGR